MKRIKVMIVDDEVLAIRHIKQLIDWESLGFEMAGESTFPEKALAMVRQLQPQVIFVDIRMPALDGLAFSRKALEAARDLKIVLLTSYKEFEYAKEAVKIGVYDYWVKHELKADQLAKELIKIKNELEREQRKELLIRRQLYRDLLAGRELPGEQIALLNGTVPAYGYVWLTVQPKRPYPVMPHLSERPVNAAQDPVPPMHMENGIFTLLETLPLEEGRQGFLFAAGTRLNSERQWIEEVRSISETIHRYCHEKTGTTIVLAASRPFDDIAGGLCKAYRETLRLLEASVFFAKNKPILPHEVGEAAPEPPRRSLAQPDPPASSHPPGHPLSLAPVREALASRNAEALRAAIYAVFAGAVKQRQPELFRAVCSELLDALNRFRTDNRLPQLGEGAAAAMIDPSQWHHADSIRDWFAAVFQGALGEASGPAPARFSRKIRQTLEHMHAHFAEDLTAEDLAERVGVTGDRLRHLFKEETGQTVLEYMTQLRIEQAKRLLATGKYKIYEIAEKTGYKSSQYFSQVFRKATGVGPLEYAEGKGAAAGDHEN
ncbi:response regulator transcription factor [Paenibacillus hamazuiensis]|uniref:response regulator transcription factor n=1 Tax=Paenibacillus hamazuiensis TaxID=2936508 RepID=UPI00200D7140